VSTARQPGSTLKPFVYALALEAGWSAATMIDDAPFAQSVGNGQHAYRNYSRVHYGAVSVREALGNSLNVPAVKALAFVGAGTLLERLQRLGMRSLHQHADVYGDGLALGNGEVSLHELVEAYAALANGGAWRPLRLLEAQPVAAQRQVLDRGASTVIADILADADARAREFGSAGVLSLPIPTAVKTGTSSDHHDAWAMGFDHRHVVGVWMGSLERRAMHRVSGASGPALVLRGVFARLNRDGEGAPLPRHAALERRSVCADDGHAPRADCRRTREEWFLPARMAPPPAGANAAPRVRIRQPAPELMLALDPRLPRAAQRHASASRRQWTWRAWTGSSTARESRTRPGATGCGRWSAAHTPCAQRCTAPTAGRDSARPRCASRCNERLRIVHHACCDSERKIRTL
jgi:penicillin-binding protein 1C